MARKFNRKQFALFILLVALVGFAVALPILYNTMGPKPKKPISEPPLILADSEWKNILNVTAGKPLGKPKTPFTIVEFGDFQCEPCHEIRPYLEGMVKDHPDKVNLMFVNRPLPKSHEFAIGAAEFATVVAQYKDFWKAYDFLYDRNKDLEPGFYVDYAKDLGLTPAQYADPAKNKAAKDFVQKSKEYCNSHEIKTTPTLVVRDNATGKLTAFVGLDDAKHYCMTAPWMTSGASPSTGDAPQTGIAPDSNIAPLTSSPLPPGGILQPNAPLVPGTPSGGLPTKKTGL